MDRIRHDGSHVVFLCGLVVWMLLGTGCEALQNLLNASAGDQEKVADCFQACISKCETGGGTQGDCLVECGNQIQECLKDLPAADGGTASQKCDDGLGTCLTACGNQNGGDTCFAGCKTQYRNCLNASASSNPPQDCQPFKNQCVSFCRPQDTVCFSNCEDLFRKCQQTGTQPAGGGGTVFPSQPCDLMKLECAKACATTPSSTCLADCDQRYRTCIQQTPAGPIVADPCKPPMDRCVAGCGASINPQGCLNDCNLKLQECRNLQPPPASPPQDACGQVIDGCSNNCTLTHAGDPCFSECKIRYQTCLDQTRPPVDPCLTQIEGCMGQCQLSGANPTCYTDCQKQADQCHAGVAPPPPPALEPCQKSLNACVPGCAGLTSASAPDGACLEGCRQDFIDCISA